MNAKSLANEFVQQSIGLLEQANLKILHCLSQLSEDQVWHRRRDCENSIGNLVLHICGNLNQWGVVAIQDLADQRKRDDEFSRRGGLAKSDLQDLARMEIGNAAKTWNALTSEQLLIRKQVQGFDVTQLEAILHTSSHFVGHTHQIILLTRQLLGDDYRFHWNEDLPRDQVPI